MTGHRPKRLRANAADSGILRQRVDEVLTGIAAAVADVRHSDRRTPYSDEATLLRVVSPLAEGSDRLFARAALELKPTPFDLQCVFPFAADVYRHDFIERTEWEHPGSADEFDELRGRASAVLELDSDPTAPNAYVAVGLTTVRQSDVLLAIWDQGEAQGPGGTPEIVLEALIANLPVIGIDARRQQDHAIAFVELHHGKVLWGGWSLGELMQKLHTVFALPPSHEEHDHDPVAPAGRIDLAHALFEEPAAPAPPATLYAKVTSWAARLTGDAEFRPLLSDDVDQLVHAPAARTEDDAPHGGLLTQEVQRDVAPSFRSAMLRDLVARLEGAIGAAYTWTDLQANRYAALHRRHVSRSTLLLIPIAILAGFVVQRCFNAEMIGDGWAAAALRIGLSFVELGCVIAIFDSYVTVREQRYHDRWLDYRSIAEKLRHIIMLLPLGRPGIDAELPPTLGENDARAHWTNWYVRAVTREAGVLSGQLFAPEYRQACHALLRHWLVRGQIRYHFHAAARAHAPLHLLHKYRYVIFTFLVLSPVVDFITEPIPEAHHTTRLLIECLAELVFFCVPAIFGSFYAFTRLSDFENIEVRGRAELQRLMRVDRELSEQSDQSSVDLLRATTMTSHAMLAELVEWRIAAALRKPELGG